MTDFLLATDIVCVAAGQERAVAGLKKRLLQRFGTSSPAADADLRFVLKEPGSLRLALDPKEVQVILGICDQGYAHACAEGRLLSSKTGRDYFEPILSHHSFWDVLRFRLLEELSIRCADKAQLLDEFLEAVAVVLDSEACLATSLASIFGEAHVFASKLLLTDTVRPQLPSVFGLSIGAAVAFEFAGFGSYCRRRIRDQHAQIVWGSPMQFDNAAVAGSALL